MGKGRFAIPLAAIIVCVSLATAYSAYMAHKDKDSPVVLDTYPQIAGTALDQCAMCHTRGEAPTLSNPDGEPVSVSTCDYCHHTVRVVEKHVGLTLNCYGMDYLEAGANAEALAAIEDMDSDGDGVSNIEEIEKLTQPGNPVDKPGAPEAPHRVFTLEELRNSGIDAREQIIFVNVTKSREGDSYRTFKGFKLSDVIELAGATQDAESVDVISIDTYRWTFSIEGLDTDYPQAPPAMGLDRETMGECGWVRYEAEGLEEGKPLEDANVLLTYAMNGKQYGPAKVDPEKGKLMGYGFYRLVAPQMIEPSPPDISSLAGRECIDAVDPEFHYDYDGYEKNSDYCVKAVLAIRVNPLPEGTVDYNWQEHAQEFMDEGKVVVYGAIESNPE